MYAFTYKLVLSCEFCNLAKRTGNALQMQRQLTHRVYYHFNAYFVGPFVKDSKGMRCILVMIDRLTHFAMLIALPNITADMVINAINNQFIKYFG